MNNAVGGLALRQGVRVAVKLVRELDRAQGVRAEVSSERARGVNCGLA